MVDFNTKKNILKKLRRVRSENKLLWLPCVIAAAFVKLWYGAACRIGMALSDKNGNFLGIKMPERKSAPRKARRQDDIVYVKRPFLGRVMSAVLAAAFVLMVAPELDIDFGITANAIGPDDVWYEHDDGTFKKHQFWPDATPGSTLYIYDKDYRAANNYTGLEIGDAVMAYGNLRLSWWCNSSEFADFFEPDVTHELTDFISAYDILITNSSSKKLYEGTLETRIKSVENYEFNLKNWTASDDIRIKITPIFSVPAWESMWKTDPEDPTKEALYVVPTGGKVFAPVTSSHSKEKSFGKADARFNAAKMNVYLTNDKGNNTDEFYPDSGEDVNIVWQQPNMILNNTEILNEYPDGYWVYLYDYTENRLAAKSQLYDVGNDKTIIRGIRTLFDRDIAYGHHYRIFVEAYKNIWDGIPSDYNVKNTGLISSNLGTLGKSDAEIYSLYLNYPDGGGNLCQELFVAPRITFDKVTYDKQSITVSWKKDSSSTYAGVEIYRSTEDIQVGDLLDVLVKNGDNPGNEYGVKKITEILNDKTLSYTDKDINKDTSYYYYIVPFVTRRANDTNRIRGTAARDKGNLEFMLTQVRITYTTDNGEVKLKWTPSRTANNSYGNADGYKLEIFQKKRYNPDTKGFETIPEGSQPIFTDDTFGPNDLSYNHDGLFNKEVYTYVVTPYVNVNPQSGPPKPFYGPSTSVDVTVGGLLGIPENVTAECTADGEVTIKWDKVPNASGYTIEYTDEYNGEVVTGTLDSKTNTKVHKGLLLNHVITYYVTAYKNVTVQYESQTIYGEKSVPAKVKVGSTLARPQNLKATTTDGTVNITWSDVQGAKGYLLQYKYKKKDGTSVEFVDDITQIKDNVFDLTDKKYTHSGLRNGDRYTYRVLAYKEVSGETVYSPWSDEAWVIVGVPLDAPKDFSGTTKDGRVDLKWTAVKGAEGYILTYRKNGGAWEEFDVSKTSFQHIGLNNGDRYEYYVKAYKTVNGERIFSDEAMSNHLNFTIGDELGAPKDFNAVAADGKATLTWTAVKGAEGYIVYAYSGGRSYQFNVSKPTYTHTGLLNGEIWTYYVTAYKTVNGERTSSNPSESKTVTIGNEFGSVKDFSVVAADGQATLKWTAVKDAEGYVVHAYSGGRSYQFDVSKSPYVHSGLLNGEIWTYYVTAYKTVNGEKIYSNPSESKTVTIGSELSSIKDFNVVTADGQATLTWTAVTGAEGYIVYANSNGRSYQFNVSKPSYVHTGLSNGEVWTYYVAAYKTVNGERIYGNPSESKTVTIGISLNSAVDLTATAGNRQIDLKWTAVKGAEGYVVYLYNSATMEFEPITVTSKTTYSHVGLKNGKQYTYMVAPYKTINGQRFYGDYSISVTAIPTTGSITDIDHELKVKGTAPYGISHGEYIKATSNHGAFDESVDVYFTTNRESTQAVRDVLKNYADGLSSFIIYPFDISIYRENTLIKVDPADGYNVTITMPVPDRLIAYRDYITVVHIGSGDYEAEEMNLAEDWFDNYDRRLEVLPCAIVDIDNVWCVQFNCSSFSPFALVIYKEHIQDVASGGGLLGGDFADTFNSGVLLFTALPDIMPHNRKLRIVQSGSKRYRIKSVTKK